MYSLTLKNNNRIKRIRTTGEEGIKPNENLSFHFVLDGNEDIVTNNYKVSVFPDSFFCLNPGTPYTSVINSPAPANVISLNYDQQFIRDFLAGWQVPSRQLLDNHTQYAGLSNKKFMETLYPFKGDIKYTVLHLDTILCEHGVDEMLVDEYLYHILLNYHELYYKEVFAREEKLDICNRATRNEIYRRLNMAKDYLYSNYNLAITIEEVALHACLSVTHLRRMFKQAYNMSPYQFLLQIRLRRAKMFLRSTDYPVNEIVNIIGFESAASFGRLFRQQFAVTPMHYRNSA